MLPLYMVSFSILFFLEPGHIWKCNMKKVKSASVSRLSCPALCDPMDRSPPDSSAHGILRARILELVAILLFSRESSQPRDQTQVYCIAGRFFTI